MRKEERQKDRDMKRNESEKGGQIEKLMWRKRKVEEEERGKGTKYREIKWKREIEREREGREKERERKVETDRRKSEKYVENQTNR